MQPRQPRSVLLVQSKDFCPLCPLNLSPGVPCLCGCRVRPPINNDREKEDKNVAGL